MPNRCEFESHVWGLSQVSHKESKGQPEFWPWPHPSHWVSLGMVLASWSLSVLGEKCR